MIANIWSASQAEAMLMVRVLGGKMPGAPRCSNRPRWSK